MRPESVNALRTLHTRKFACISIAYAPEIGFHPRSFDHMRVRAGAQRMPEDAPMGTKITAHVTGTVWKVEKQPGDSVRAGEAVVILESMKMELPVESPVGGQVREVRCAPGQAVEEGAVLAVVE